MKENHDPMLSIKEMADLIGLKPSTIYHMIEKGQCP